jgi:hypothetical protein
MIDYNEYFDEVIQAHLVIERWFAVEQDPAELARLLSRFSTDFSMVTPLGRMLDIEALRGLFQSAGGKKPGFRIELSELRGIALHAHGATLSYREQQSDASGLLIAGRQWCLKRARRAGAVAAFAGDVLRRVIDPIVRRTSRPLREHSLPQGMYCCSPVGSEGLLAKMATRYFNYPQHDPVHHHRAGNPRRQQHALRHFIDVNRTGTAAPGAPS